MAIGADPGAVAGRDTGHSSSPIANAGPNGRFRGRSCGPSVPSCSTASGNSSHRERHGGTTEISLKRSSTTRDALPESIRLTPLFPPILPLEDAPHFRMNDSKQPAIPS
jgi:hypothetical protein